MSSTNEWLKVKLGELALIQAGGTPPRKNPQNFGEGLPWVKISDMDSLIVRSTEESITKLGVENSSAKLFPEGTILLSIFATVGKVAVLGIPATTNQAIAGIQLKTDAVLPSFLVHFLKFSERELKNLGRGVAQNNINLSKLRNFQIPLPPLAEQQRIADVLNQTTSILEFARQEVRKIDESRSALFESLFPASNYPASTIGNFLSETQYGSSKKSAETGKYPMLRMGNLSSTGSISYSDLKYLNLEKKEINKYTLRNHDILFNRTNSKELVGKTAVYYGEDDQIAYAGYLIRCRTNDLATPEFISGFLNSRIGKAQLFQRAKAIVGMANINAKELRTLRIPAVPVEEQEKYTSASRQLENLRLAVEKKVEKLEELQQSLSTRAFAGQL